MNEMSADLLPTRMNTQNLSLLFSVINLLPNAISIKNTDHIRVAVNTAFCKLTGYAEENLIGKSEFNAMTTDQIEMSWNQDKEVLSTRGANTLVREIIDAEGEPRWMEIKKSYFQDVSGEEYVITVLTDITDLKNRELELLEEEKLAVQRMKARSAFIANMGEDIRLPMADILRLTQGLAATDLDETQEELIENFGHSSGRLVRIINDIMDFAKIDSGLMKVDAKSFVLENIFDEIAETIGHTVREKGLDLVLIIDPDLPRSFIGDSQKVKQILFNLIENATKFTHQGFIAISVSSVESQEHMQLKFSVKDTGIGMPASEIAHLFNSLNHNKDTVGDISGVSGLGLSLCKKLARLMGGDIYVSSELHKGTEFTFDINVPSDRKDNATRKSTLLSGLSLNERILFIDDHKVNFEAASKMLQTFGITADYADSANMALNKLQISHHERRPYTIIFIDYLMPNQNGLLLTRAIADVNEFAKAKIVAMSSVNDTEIRDCFLSYNVVDYVEKPLTPKNLSRSLKKAVA